MRDECVATSGISTLAWGKRWPFFDSCRGSMFFGMSATATPRSRAGDYPADDWYIGGHHKTGALRAIRTQSETFLAVSVEGEAERCGEVAGRTGNPHRPIVKGGWLSRQRCPASLSTWGISVTGPGRPRKMMSCRAGAARRRNIGKTGRRETWVAVGQGNTGGIAAIA